MDNSTATPAETIRGATVSPSLALFIGLPLIVVIFAAILVLLLVLGWLSLRSRVRTARTYRYASVPTKDPMHFSRLPYKPTGIKLGDPPLPTMSFHMATQFNSPISPASAHYPNPFSPHRSQSKASLYSGENRPPRLRTRPKGNHKHKRGIPSTLHEAEPTPEVVEEDKKKERSERSLSIVSLGGAASELNGSLLLPGKKTSSNESSRDKAPEIFLTLRYNKDTSSLVVRVERVVGLPFRDDGTEVDAYVRLYFVPKIPELPQRKTSKTRLARQDSAPVYEEEICYEGMSDGELINSTLHMQVLDYQSYGKHRLLGQADLHLVQVSFDGGVASINMTMQQPRARENLGTVLLSLCYSPETKRLSVIILRAKDLNRGVAKDIDSQAKLCVTHGDKVLGKLKTKKKPQSCSPIFNEALTCNVEPEAIRSVLVCTTMTNESSRAARKEVGQVVLGSQTLGEEYRHWSDILATPGKHIAEWHELR